MWNYSPMYRVQTLNDVISFARKIVDSVLLINFVAIMVLLGSVALLDKPLATDKFTALGISLACFMFGMITVVVTNLFIYFALEKDITTRSNLDKYEKITEITSAIFIILSGSALNLGISQALKYFSL